MTIERAYFEEKEDKALQRYQEEHKEADPVLRKLAFVEMIQL
jgi:hypothetical protein